MILIEIPSLPCLQIPTSRKGSLRTTQVVGLSRQLHYLDTRRSDKFLLSIRSLPTGLARRRESPRGTWHECQEQHKTRKERRQYEIMKLVLILPISLVWKIIHQEVVILQQRNICYKITHEDFTGQLNYGLY